MEKTLLDYFNEFATENYCNFVDFLREASEDEVKEVISKLDDLAYKELYKYLDSFIFETKEEVEREMIKFIEEFEMRCLGMWEMGDIGDYADDYINGRYEIDDDDNLKLLK